MGLPAVEWLRRFGSAGTRDGAAERARSGDAVHPTVSAFTLTVAAFLAYAAFFIYRTSFLVNGERYFSLFDDAMVSMRYARNLANGYGLVWNPGGERVEGFTNPLWVLFMSLVHLLPLAQSKISLVVQLTAAACLAVNLYFVRRIALAVSGGAPSVAIGAVVLTAFYLPINNWSLQGMEVGVLVMLTTICTWLAMQCVDAAKVSRPVVQLYLLLGVATLVRLDMAVLFVAIAVFLAAADPEWRGSHARWALLVLTAAAGIQTILRVWYYGELLPNTYYLKMTGVPTVVRLERGLYVLLLFVWKSNPLLFVLPALLLLRRDKRIWLLACVLGSQIGYSVYVGGDAWEYWGGSNRYISIAMPTLFVLLSQSLHLVVTALAAMLQAKRGTTARPLRASGWLFALSLGYAVVCMNSLSGIGALKEAALLVPPLNAGEGGGNQRDVVQALALRRMTTPEAAIAVVRAGTIPYFADRRAVDLLGKTDAHVARAPIPAGPIGFRDFRPGHIKTDFGYSIGVLQPDVIVHLRRRTDLAQPFMSGAYRAFLVGGNSAYVRRGSPHVLWDLLAGHTCDGQGCEQ